MFEDEEDMNDSLRQEGVLCGEEWLMSQFLLSNGEALSQTVTINRKIEQENKDKLNRSDISRNARPISPFVAAADGNPFEQSKVAYMAHPSSLDRSLPSALKTRNKIPRTPDNLSSLDPNWKDNFQPDKPYDLNYLLQQQSSEARNPQQVQKQLHDQMKTNAQRNGSNQAQIGYMQYQRQITNAKIANDQMRYQLPTDKAQPTDKRVY